MTPAALIAAVEKLGVRLRPDAHGRQLFAVPRGRLPADLKAKLRARKNEVIVYLQAAAVRRTEAEDLAMAAPVACADCGSTRHTISIVYSDGTRSCAACITGVTQMRARGIPL